MAPRPASEAPRMGHVAGQARVSMCWASTTSVTCSRSAAPVPTLRGPSTASSACVVCSRIRPVALPPGKESVWRCWTLKLDTC